jgi:hypothetical protein
MNLRHAAALALVGWYLMAPSFVDWTFVQKNLGQPKTKYATVELSPTWDTLRTFDTASQCWAAKEKLFDKFDNRTMLITFEQFQSVYAECISSDDPRLKER